MFFLHCLTCALLMPPWEGFDEVFHYGYISTLSSGALPQPGLTLLPPDVARSFSQHPISPVVQKNFPRLKTFEEFSRGITPPPTPDPPLPILNYESHQAPLYYVLFSPLNLVLTWLPVELRLLALRIFSSVVGGLFVAFIAMRTTSLLDIDPAWASVSAYAASSIQMVVSAFSRVSNDMLAIILLTFLLLELTATIHRKPVLANPVNLLLLAILTKSYFLVLLPLLFFLKIRSSRPSIILLLSTFLWLARNLFQTGSLVGAQELSQGHTSLDCIFQSLPQLLETSHWKALFLGALWTSNNHFGTFSVTWLTLQGLLILLCISSRFFRDPPLQLTSLLWLVFLAFSILASFCFTGGKSVGTSPWYLVPLLFVLVLIGGARSSLFAKPFLIALIAIQTVILAASYAYKWIPLYAGISLENGTLPFLKRTYLDNFATLSTGLERFTILHSPLLIFALSATSTLASCWLTAQAIRYLSTKRKPL